jgi:hypothetical protein
MHVVRGIRRELGHPTMETASSKGLDPYTLVCDAATSDLHFRHFNQKLDLTAASETSGPCLPVDVSLHMRFQRGFVSRDAVASSKRDQNSVNAH